MEKEITLFRDDSLGFGFSIIGGKGSCLPPIVCEIIERSPAELNGNIEAGDVLLEVNGDSVVDFTTREVVNRVKASGTELRLRLRNDPAVKTQAERFLYCPPEDTVTLSHVITQDDLEGVSQLIVKRHTNPTPKLRRKISSPADPDSSGTHQLEDSFLSDTQLSLESEMLQTPEAESGGHLGHAQSRLPVHQSHSGFKPPSTRGPGSRQYQLRQSEELENEPGPFVRHVSSSKDGGTAKGARSSGRKSGRNFESFVMTGDMIINRTSERNDSGASDGSEHSDSVRTPGISRKQSAGSFEKGASELRESGRVKKKRLDPSSTGAVSSGLPQPTSRIPKSNISTTACASPQISAKNVGHSPKLQQRKAVVASTPKLDTSRAAKSAIPSPMSSPRVQQTTSTSSVSSIPSPGVVNTRQKRNPPVQHSSQPAKHQTLSHFEQSAHTFPLNQSVELVKHYPPLQHSPIPSPQTQARNKNRGIPQSHLPKASPSLRMKRSISSSSAGKSQLDSSDASIDSVNFPEHTQTPSPGPLSGATDNVFYSPRVANYMDCSSVNTERTQESLAPTSPQPVNTKKGGGKRGKRHSKKGKSDKRQLKPEQNQGDAESIRTKQAKESFDSGQDDLCDNRKETLATRVSQECLESMEIDEERVEDVGFEGEAQGGDDKQETDKPEIKGCSEQDNQDTTTVEGFDGISHTQPVSIHQEMYSKNNSEAAHTSFPVQDSIPSSFDMSGAESNVDDLSGAESNVDNLSSVETQGNKKQATNELLKKAKGHFGIDSANLSMGSQSQHNLITVHHFDSNQDYFEEPEIPGSVETHSLSPIEYEESENVHNDENLPPDRKIFEAPPLAQHDPSIESQEGSEEHVNYVDTTATNSDLAQDAVLDGKEGKVNVTHVSVTEELPYIPQIPTYTESTPISCPNKDAPKHWSPFAERPKPVYHACNALPVALDIPPDDICSEDERQGRLDYSSFDLDDLPLPPEELFSNTFDNLVADNETQLTSMIGLANNASFFLGGAHMYPSNNYGDNGMESVTNNTLVGSPIVKKNVMAPVTNSPELYLLSPTVTTDWQLVNIEHTLGNSGSPQEKTRQDNLLSLQPHATNTGNILYHSGSCTYMHNTSRQDINTSQQNMAITERDEPGIRSGGAPLQGPTHPTDNHPIPNYNINTNAFVSIASDNDEGMSTNPNVLTQLDEGQQKKHDDLMATQTTDNITFEHDSSVSSQSLLDLHQDNEYVQPPPAHPRLPRFDGFSQIVSDARDDLLAFALSELASNSGVSSNFTAGSQGVTAPPRDRLERQTGEGTSGWEDKAHPSVGLSNGLDEGSSRLLTVDNQPATVCDGEKSLSSTLGLNTNVPTIPSAEVFSLGASNASSVPTESPLSVVDQSASDLRHISTTDDRSVLQPDSHTVRTSQFLHEHEFPVSYLPTEPNQPTASPTTKIATEQANNSTNRTLSYPAPSSPNVTQPSPQHCIPHSITAPPKPHTQPSPYQTASPDREKSSGTSTVAERQRYDIAPSCPHLSKQERQPDSHRSPENVTPSPPNTARADFPSFLPIVKGQTPGSHKPRSSGIPLPKVGGSNSGGSAGKKGQRKTEEKQGQNSALISNKQGFKHRPVVTRHKEKSYRPALRVDGSKEANLSSFSSSNTADHYSQAKNPADSASILNDDSDTAHNNSKQDLLTDISGTKLPKANVPSRSLDSNSSKSEPLPRQQQQQQQQQHQQGLSELDIIAPQPNSPLVHLESNYADAHEVYFENLLESPPFNHAMDNSFTLGMLTANNSMDTSFTIVETRGGVNTHAARHSGNTALAAPGVLNNNQAYNPEEPLHTVDTLGNCTIPGSLEITPGLPKSSSVKDNAPRCTDTTLEYSFPAVSPTKEVAPSLVKHVNTPSNDSADGGRDSNKKRSMVSSKSAEKIGTKHRHSASTGSAGIVPTSGRENSAIATPSGGGKLNHSGSSASPMCGRNSKSQENYLDDEEMKLIVIDFDENMASSVDALHYDQSTTSLERIDAAMAAVAAKNGYGSGGTPAGGIRGGAEVFLSTEISEQSRSVENSPERRFTDKQHNIPTFFTVSSGSKGHSAKQPEPRSETANIRGRCTSDTSGYTRQSSASFSNSRQSPRHRSSGSYSDHVFGEAGDPQLSPTRRSGSKPLVAGQVVSVYPAVNEEESVWIVREPSEGNLVITISSQNETGVNTGVSSSELSTSAAASGESHSAKRKQKGDKRGDKKSPKHKKKGNSGAGKDKKVSSGDVKGTAVKVNNTSSNRKTQVSKSIQPNGGLSRNNSNNTDPSPHCTDTTSNRAYLGEAYSHHSSRNNEPHSLQSVVTTGISAPDSCLSPQLPPTTNQTAQDYSRLASPSNRPSDASRVSVVEGLHSDNPSSIPGATNVSNCANTSPPQLADFPLQQLEGSPKSIRKRYQRSDSAKYSGSVGPSANERSTDLGMAMVAVPPVNHTSRDGLIDHASLSGSLPHTAYDQSMVSAATKNSQTPRYYGKADSIPNGNKNSNGSIGGQAPLHANHVMPTDSGCNTHAQASHDQIDGHMNGLSRPHQTGNHRHQFSELDQAKRHCYYGQGGTRDNNDFTQSAQKYTTPQDIANDSVLQKQYASSPIGSAYHQDTTQSSYGASSSPFAHKSVTSKPQQLDNAQTHSTHKQPTDSRVSDPHLHSPSTATNQGDISATVSNVDTHPSEFLDLNPNPLSPESDADSIYHQPLKDVDVPSAMRLAKRLYNLEGFRKSDISKHLSKKNDFAQQVGEEFLKYFELGGLSLDEAILLFLQRITLAGETQERERVLVHFSRRYVQCNPGTFNSEDACHTLLCALMLLNTDLHGQNVGRKMTSQEFIENLSTLNDGSDFPREVLKNLYASIKSSPLEMEFDENTDVSGAQDFDLLQAAGPGHGAVTGRARDAAGGTAPPRFAGHNPFLEVPDPNKGTEYIKGFVMRKCCKEPDGRRTPVGKRAWKMYYAVLKDMVLFLHKDEHAYKKNAVFDNVSNAIRVHHSLATKASDYKKKHHVFRVTTADWAEYLFQTGNPTECQRWIDAMNTVAATLSAPPLPSAVGSQRRFQKPLLPVSCTKYNAKEQLQAHEQRRLTIERDLADHRKYPPEKGAKARLIQEYVDKETYLQYEARRYKTYCLLLQNTRTTYPPELEPSLVETAICEVSEPPSPNTEHKELAIHGGGGTSQGSANLAVASKSYPVCAAAVAASVANSGSVSETTGSTRKGGGGGGRVQRNVADSTRFSLPEEVLSRYANRDPAYQGTAV